MTFCAYNLCQKKKTISKSLLCLQVFSFDLQIITGRTRTVRIDGKNNKQKTFKNSASTLFFLEIKILNKIAKFGSVFEICSWESFALFSTHNRFETSVPISLFLRNLSLLVERVSLCSLHIIALKLVCQLCYCYKICPC